MSQQRTAPAPPAPAELRPAAPPAGCSEPALPGQACHSVFRAPPAPNGTPQSSALAPSHPQRCALCTWPLHCLVIATGRRKQRRESPLMLVGGRPLSRSAPGPCPQPPCEGVLLPAAVHSQHFFFSPAYLQSGALFLASILALASSNWRFLKSSNPFIGYEVK